MDSLTFLPGWGCDAWLFAHQIENLKQDYETHVISTLMLKNLDDSLADILAKLPLKTTIIGHAMGGWLAQWLAIRYPDRVNKLILMNTGTGRVLNNFMKANQAIVDFQNLQRHPYSQMFNHKDNPMFAQTINQGLSFMKTMASHLTLWQTLFTHVIKGMQTFDTSGQLSEIKCPTLLIHGKNDVIFAKEMIFLNEKIVHSCWLEINDCGPLMTWEQPQLVSSFMKSWLQS